MLTEHQLDQIKAETNRLCRITAQESCRVSFSYDNSLGFQWSARIGAAGVSSTFGFGDTIQAATSMAVDKYDKSKDAKIRELEEELAALKGA